MARYYQQLLGILITILITKIPFSALSKSVHAVLLLFAVLILFLDMSTNKVSVSKKIVHKLHKILILLIAFILVIYMVSYLFLKCM